MEISQKEVNGWIYFSKTEGIEELRKVAFSTSFWSDFAREGAKKALEKLERKPGK
jgi:hypothetical protein